MPNKFTSFNDMFFSGAVKLSSNCESERQLAIYLFATSIQGFIFWVAVIIIERRGSLEEAIYNPCFEFYLYLQTLVAVAGLVIGTC